MEQNCDKDELLREIADALTNNGFSVAGLAHALKTVAYGGRVPPTSNRLSSMCETMTGKNEFCKQFVAAFCGTWCANNYEDACMCGEHDRLEHPPAEDAAFLAEEIWERSNMESLSSKGMVENDENVL